MTTAPVFVTYDSEADALYVYLIAQDTDVDRTEAFGDGRMVDYDAQGQVVGVEFLDASRGIDIDGLPEADRVAEAVRPLPQLAAADCGANGGGGTPARHTRYAASPYDAATP